MQQNTLPEFPLLRYSLQQNEFLDCSSIHAAANDRHHKSAFVFQYTRGRALRHRSRVLLQAEGSKNVQMLLRQLYYQLRRR